MRPLARERPWSLGSTGCSGGSRGGQTALDQEGLLLGAGAQASGACSLSLIPLDRHCESHRPPYRVLQARELWPVHPMP